MRLAEVRGQLDRRGAGGGVGAGGRTTAGKGIVTVIGVVGTHLSTLLPLGSKYTVVGWKNVVYRMIKSFRLAKDHLCAMGYSNITVVPGQGSIHPNSYATHPRSLNEDLTVDSALPLLWG